MNGGTPREIRVLLNPEALNAYQVSPQQVSQALARENMEVPAGRIYLPEQEKLVRVTGRIRDPMAFHDVVVATRQGVPVRVRDVATVVDGAAERRSSAYLGTREAGETRAVSVEVLKISGSNTVEVADAVRSRIDELAQSLPTDIEMRVIRDDSVKIRHALSDVQITIMLGAVLTILIIYLFLNSWRSTVITGLTLPISVISAFFAMYLFGFTINTMTLGGLAIAVGLLVDASIIVTENVVHRLAPHASAAGRRNGTSAPNRRAVSATRSSSVDTTRRST